MWLSVGGLCAASLSLAALFLYLDPQVPKAETYRNVQLETPLRIFAEDGALLAEFGERRLIPITLEQVPDQFINALLDTEDKRFYEHSGIDFISLANDMVGLVGTLITEGELGPGASTITMQLARNVSFSLERRFLRKFKEMLLALKIERELSKQEILELYINVVPFGKRAYGAEAAARTYYGKPLADLSLPQLAMLAGIPQAPSAGNPINGPERALRRRNLVLSRMFTQGSIDQDEYQAAIGAPISAQIYQRELDLPSPYPSEWARSQAISTLPDLYTAGYEIHTTINAKLQKAAIEAVRKGLISYDRRHGYRGVEGQLSEALVTQLQQLSTADVTSIQTGAEAVVDAAIADTGNGSIEAQSAELLDEEPEAMLADTDVHSQVLEELEDLPTYGGLLAAAVLSISEEQADLLTAGGERVSLPLEAIAWARPYLDVDVRGAAPDQFSDVFNVGDIVRLEAHSEGWRLSQLPEIQGALIALDPKDGKVRALVGGFDFYRNQYNHALQAARQPGSGFKPFVYSGAVAAGVTPADIFMDAPLVFDDANLESQYRPDNDNNAYNGPTRLREALYRSINLVSMRVLLEVGAGRIIEHSADLGFSTQTFPRNTQLAIGGGTMAVTPVDMVRAYAIFANNGFLIQPHIIDYIKDADGNEVFRSNQPIVCADCLDEAELEPAEEPSSLDQLFADLESEAEELDLELLEPTEEALPLPEATISEADTEPRVIEHEPIFAERVLDERNTYIVNSMLRDVIQKGTGRRARSLGRNDIAGKTGTTNDAADTWFNGYHPDLAVTVWVGFSNHQPLGAREYGSNTPLPIWIDFMASALPTLEKRVPTQPAGLVTLKIDPETGELAKVNQANAMFEYFLAEHAPKSRNTVESKSPEDQEVNAIDLF